MASRPAPRHRGVPAQSQIRCPVISVRSREAMSQFGSRSG